MITYCALVLVGVYIGFDAPRTLGKKHYGSKVAGPIFKAFMKKALDGKPVTPFKTPKGVKMLRVNAFTGARAEPGEANTIYEAFRPGTELPDHYNLPTWDNPYQVAGEESGYGYPASLFGPRSVYTPEGDRVVTRSGGSDSSSSEQSRNAYTHQSGAGSHSSRSNNESVSGTGGLY